MQFIRTIPAILFIFLFITSCKEPPANKPERPLRSAPPKRVKPAKSGFTLVSAKQWLQSDQGSRSEAQRVVMAVNRVDLEHLRQMDSIVVPQDLGGDIAYYLPFPLEVSEIEDIPKLIYFSYPSQTFGAYEYGQLVYTGPTNMGRKKDPTPTGLFHTNWKAEKTTSTFNDEWELKWNFNIQNKEGIGWHEYAMPGYPASHSCLRLLEKDARYLYDWAEQWKIKGTDDIIKKGTPVIVFGTYDFDAPKPWRKVLADPHALDISEKDLEAQTAPFLEELKKDGNK